MIAVTVFPYKPGQHTLAGCPHAHPYAWNDCLRRIRRHRTSARHRFPARAQTQSWKPGSGRSALAPTRGVLPTLAGRRGCSRPTRTGIAMPRRQFPARVTLSPADTYFSPTHFCLLPFRVSPAVYSPSDGVPRTPVFLGQFDWPSRPIVSVTSRSGHWPDNSQRSLEAKGVSVLCGSQLSVPGMSVW